MTLATYQWTIERYHQAIDAGLFADESVELLRGDLVAMPRESVAHAYYTSEVGDYLRKLLGDRALISEGHPITLPNNSEPEPDLAIAQALGREHPTLEMSINTQHIDDKEHIDDKGRENKVSKLKEVIQ